MHDDTITDDDLARATADGADRDWRSAAARTRRYSALDARGRAWVARWPGARPEVLAQLAAADPDDRVRSAAALAAAERCDDDIIVAALLRGEHSPELAELAAASSSVALRDAAARHWATPPAAVERLAGDPDPGVRWAVICRPDVPDAVLRRVSRRDAVADHRRVAAYYRALRRAPAVCP